MEHACERKRVFGCLFVATVCLWFANPASTYAADANDAALPSWYLTIENDGLAAFSGSDEFYSQGLQLGYSFDPNEDDRGLRAPARWLEHRLQANMDDSHHAHVGSAASWFIGQNIFTPGTLKSRELLADDRPYAGWLYLGARVDLAYLRPGTLDVLGVYHSFEVQLGVIGPLSNAEWSQAQAHKLVNDEPPLGWDHQLPNEFGVFGRYMWQRGYALTPDTRLKLDVWPQAEVAAGNVATYLQGGAIVRFGYNLGAPVVGTLSPTKSATAFAVPPDEQGRFKLVKPRLTTRCFNSTKAWLPEECFGYVGAVARVSVYNSFLDGTAFHDSHSVDKKRLVYDLTWGFRTRWQGVQVDYAFIRRTQEFTPVPMHADTPDGSHDYGSITARCLNSNQWYCPALVAIALGVLATAQ